MKKTIPFLFLLLVSCTEWKVDAHKSDIDTLFSVSCFLNPADSLVSLGLFSLKEIDKPVKMGSIDLSFGQALVKLKTNGKEYLLNYNEDKGRYESQPFEIELLEGQNYCLEIMANEQTLKACTEIPAKAVELPIFELVESTNSYNTAFRFGFTDPDSNAHTYMVFTNLRYKQDIGFGHSNFHVDGLPTFVESSPGMKNDFSYIGYFHQNSPSKKELATDITVFSLSPEMKSFLDDGFLNKPSETVGLFERYQNPKNRYTNIENGLGIFAAYSVLKLVYPIEK